MRERGIEGMILGWKMGKWGSALAGAWLLVMGSAFAQQAPSFSRIVVFGDSDFVTNGYLGIPGNRDLFLNSVNWLAQQENLISIRPKDPEDRRVSLTSDQAKLIFWLSILIIPGLILAGGVQTWWRRR